MSLINEYFLLISNKVSDNNRIIFCTQILGNMSFLKWGYIQDYRFVNVDCGINIPQKAVENKSMSKCPFNLFCVLREKCYKQMELRKYVVLGWVSVPKFYILNNEK